MNLTSPASSRRGLRLQVVFKVEPLADTLRHLEKSRSQHSKCYNCYGEAEDEDGVLDWTAILPYSVVRTPEVALMIMS